MTRAELKKLMDRQIKKNETIESMRKYVRDLSNAYETLEKKVNTLEWTIKEFRNEDILEIEEDLIEYPAQVYNESTLRQFINAEFGLDFIKEHYTPRSIACARVRNALSIRYSRIERINDQANRHNYMAGDRSHQDTIYFFDGEKWHIIDICKASKENGSLEENICWNIILETPWENRHE